MAYKHNTGVYDITKTIHIYKYIYKYYASLKKIYINYCIFKRNHSFGILVNKILLKSI